MFSGKIINQSYSHLRSGSLRTVCLKEIEGLDVPLLVKFLGFFTRPDLEETFPEFEKIIVQNCPRVSRKAFELQCARVDHDHELDESLVEWLPS